MNKLLKSISVSLVFLFCAVALASGMFVFNLSSNDKVRAAANTIESQRVVKQSEMFKSWPNNPLNYEYFDWNKRATDYYDFVYSLDKDSRYPTIVKNTQSINSNLEKYTIADYYGDARFAGYGKYGAFTNVAGTLGATLIGKDMTNVQVTSDKSLDFLKMLDELYNPELGVLLEDPRTPSFSNWWFDLLSNMMYFQIADRYTEEQAPGMQEKLKAIANSHYDMIVALGAENACFDYDGFNFVKMQPVPQAAGNPFNGSLDGGFSAALIEFWAYKIFGDVKYLNASKWCMDWYEKSREVRFFDNHTAYAPYLAARLNAEIGTQYSPEKFIKWTTSANLANIGGIATSEGGFDFYGLSGYHNSYGQKERAYLYESAQYSYFVPAVKYDLSLANDVGKYMLNLSSNARFFYPDQQPAERQIHGDAYINAQENVMAYESLEVLSKEGIANFAEGDPSRWRKTADVYPSMADYAELVEVMGPCTDLGFYGSNWSAMIGAVVKDTNVERILQLDLNALDFFADKTYPMYLYYNPYETEQTVEINLTAASDLFDSASDCYAATNVNGKATFTIPALSSRVIAVTPTGTSKKYDGRKTIIGDSVVAYAQLDDTSMSFMKDGNVTSGVANNALDGLYYTSWISENNNAQNFVIDFGKEELINTTEIIWNDDYATKYNVLYSLDGVTYTDLFGKDLVGKKGLDKNYLDGVTKPKKARYVKFAFKESVGEKFSLETIRVSRWFETDGVNLALKKDIFTNSVDDNPDYGHLLVKEHMNDGIKGTRWAAKYLKEDGKDVFVTIDFGKKYLVNQLAISWSSAYAEHYSVLVSLDGITYNAVKNVTTGKGGLENIVFDVEEARYIKLEMTKGTNIGGVVYPYSINEIEAFYIS